MTTIKYSITGLTIATTNMKAMLQFYTHVFNITFTQQTMNNFTLHQGVWQNLTLLLCPTELAKNTAKENKHQFNIEVSDLKLFIDRVQQFSGKILGEITEDRSGLSVAILDPDNNSIVLKETK